jgi:hypothetical protein
MARKKDKAVEVLRGNLAVEVVKVAFSLPFSHRVAHGTDPFGAPYELHAELTGKGVYLVRQGQPTRVVHLKSLLEAMIHASEPESP